MSSSLVTLGVRHRHVQLALESRIVRVARHDPDDARADEPRGRDAAQHLQRRRRPDREVGSRAGAGARCRWPARDAEDEATADADRPHRRLLRRRRSIRRRSKGARIGVMRQLFVGVTGEREVATPMETVIAELQRGGRDGGRRRDSRSRRAVSRRRAAARRARSRQAGTAYLSRGAAGRREGARRIDDLLASGQLAPGERAPFRGRARSQRRPASRSRSATDEVLRAPRSVPRAVRRSDGAGTARRAALSRESGAAAHARRRARALRRRARHVRGERDDGPAAGHRSRGIHRRDAIRSASRCSAGCGRTSVCSRSRMRTNRRRTIAGRRRAAEPRDGVSSSETEGKALADTQLRRLEKRLAEAPERVPAVP